MDALRQDFVYAIRTLRGSPAFTLTAILTLALGIGANAAIFSLVNAALIRALPFDRPETLVVLWGNVQRTRVERRGASYPDFLDWRAQATSFEGMAAYWATTVTLPAGEGAERVGAEVVSPAYFRLLGIPPVHGRLFDGNEEPTGAPGAALLGHGLWMRRFGGSRQALGQTIRFDRRAWTIVGVLPAGFGGLSQQAELWINAGGLLDANVAAARGNRWFPVLARLRPGVTPARAQAELDAVARRLEQHYLSTNEKRGIELAALTTELLGEVRPALLVSLAAVAVVLLIGCANVAGLVMARAEARAHEMAIRVSLGASRGRLARQLLTEGLVLALAAGALGVLVTDWVTDALLAASPISLPRFVDAGVDGTVLLFSSALSLLLGLALGLAPAWHQRDVASQAIRESSGHLTGSRRSLRARQALVVGEVSLALVLLVAAGLLLRSLAALRGVDPGFRPDGLLTLRVALPEPGGDAETAAGTAAAGPGTIASATRPEAMRLAERLRALPGVVGVALSSTLPLGSGSQAIFYTAEGQPPSEAQTMPRAYIHRVTPDFFATLGIEIVRGRTLTRAEFDREARVLVVSEGVARRFWPGRDPIGQRIKPGRADSDAPWFEIVGVVRDTQYRALPRNPTPDPDLFGPLTHGTRNPAVFVRTGGDPVALAATVREAIREVASGAAVYDVATMEDRVGEQLALQRFVSWLTGAFAALSLVLAAIGVYGVISQTVARRTQEIGVRVALGASPRLILGLVLRQGLVLTGAGLLVGLAGALAATRALGSLLFGVGPADPWTFLLVSVTLFGVALAATWVPARRALRVDPLIALRAE